MKHLPGMLPYVGPIQIRLRAYGRRIASLAASRIVNISHRWNRDKTDDLQHAFFNGEGWGELGEYLGHLGMALRHVMEKRRAQLPIVRAVAPFQASNGGPYYPTQLYGVFASKWPLAQQTVWTIVNRNEL